MPKTKPAAVDADKYCPFYRYIANFDECRSGQAAPVYVAGFCRRAECQVWVSDRCGLIGVGGVPSHD